MCLALGVLQRNLSLHSSCQIVAVAIKIYKYYNIYIVRITELHIVCETT